MPQPDRHLYVLLSVLFVLTIIAGMIVQGPQASLDGLLAIQGHPARLINDYTLIGGEGAALINAALVALMGLLVVWRTDVRLSGPTVAAVFTMLGFGLFGKTPLNIVPVMLGVYATARYLHKSFKEYILIALFGTALGPIASAVAVEAGLTGGTAIIGGALAGFAVGCLLPAAAMAMLRMHQGFNLYNIGLTSGFLAVFVAAVFAASGTSLSGQLIWNSAPSLVLVLWIPVVSVVLLVAGFWWGGRDAWRHLAKIQTLPGRLPSDFMDMTSPAGTFLNMGLLGLGAWVYVLAVSGALNGPVLGGIFTIIGFAAFGKTLRNSWPVVAGVAIATLVFDKGLNSPGPLLAALFGTTLAPLAGEFGFVIGMAAGFVHLMMVERTGAWHNGMNLYNNGFAGGVTATLFVAVIEWYRANRPQSQKAAEKERAEKAHAKAAPAATTRPAHSALDS